MNIIVNGAVVTLDLHSNEALAGGEGRVRVYNDGDNDATGVIATFTIPAGGTVTGNTPTAGAYAAGVWTIGNLASGAEEFLDLEFTISDDTLRPYVFTWVVTHDDSPDDDSTDNDGTRTIDGIPCSVLTACVNGAIAAQCGVERGPIKTVIEDYIVDENADRTIEADATAEAIVITLPLAADAFVDGCGKIFTVAAKDITNPVTVSAQVGEVIVVNTTVGAAAQTFGLTSVAQALTVQSNGTYWRAI